MRWLIKQSVQWRALRRTLHSATTAHRSNNKKASDIDWNSYLSNNMDIDENNDNNNNNNNNNNKKLVLGCGSNLVDKIFKVQNIPRAGDKGYFQSPTSILETSVVGGVTLNHLAWASLLGVPTGLLGMQGRDDAGKMVRDKLVQLGVSVDFLRAEERLTTGQSFVFVQRDGERSIVMASGATSLMTGDVVEEHFKDAVLDHAHMVTTEISQVPLSGVIQLLKMAKEAGATTVVDFDVCPSVAMNEAQLGNLKQLTEVLQLTDVLKPAKHAAKDYIALLRPDLKKALSSEETIRLLQEISGSKMVAMTDGGHKTLIATANHLVAIPARSIDHVVDATGAGDAFLGGIIAGLYHCEGIPTTEDELRALGELANSIGAAGCLVLGALPEESSRQYLSEKLGDRWMWKVFSPTPISNNDNEQKPLSEFKNSIVKDTQALNGIWNHINEMCVKNFIDSIHRCTGSVYISGIGKSGLVGERMAASLSSIGIPSHYVHTSEWSHGDFGKLRHNDVCVFFSHSGNTDEVVNVMRYLAETKKSIPLLGVVGTKDSKMGAICGEHCIYYGKMLGEPLGGIPTSSVALQNVVINGVMCELLKLMKLTRKDFQVNHPGGSLGKARVDDK